VPRCPSCGHQHSDRARFCEECGAPLGPAPASREQRKTVTVLFCDVTGSTALGESADPEALRALLARYFERMKGIVESHGGTVEKFIGDAVMAVFGVPHLHEDDALRACRTAVEMRDALPELGVQARIGLNTGEVVTGTEERLATGDAVNVAARLEQAAQPCEILIGADTLLLVGRAVETEPIEPLELRGKKEAVPAYRLLAVHAAPERPHETDFVGREAELELLREAWERAVAGGRCELVTIIGEAGVGKSRLTAESFGSIDGRLVSGRCLPYGEGITYWPVVEVVAQLDSLPSDPAAAVSLRSLLGETETGTSAEEIAWAFRKLLEEEARERPLVVVFDDIQWGEETLLDLIEHVALLSSDAPILLLGMARPELLDRRSSWPVTFRLEPLEESEVEALIGGRVDDAQRAQIVRASGGNPLFIAEILAMREETDSELAVPPSLQALLAARLDQLEPSERRVLECAAVEGEVFHRGAVQALALDEEHVTPRLAALVRRELIRPDRAQVHGDHGFRFRHLLIRDAAYGALPKAARADLHERLAEWLIGRGSELVELDEVVGYHLEQACRFRADLGLPREERLAGEAKRHLSAAGYRALNRQDYAAALRLLERAAALVPPGECDLALELELREALGWLGRSSEALQRADELAQRAATGGDEVAALCARIFSGQIRMRLGNEGARAELVALLSDALPVLEAAGNDLALYVAYDALGESALLNLSALEAIDRAAIHARRAGHEPDYRGWRAACHFFGATPASELLAWLDENEPHSGRNYFLSAYRAGSLAMLDRFDQARSLLAEMRAELAARGPTVLLANITAFESVWVELLAAEPAAAVEFGLDGHRLYLELGEKSFLRLNAGYLAQAFYALGDFEEADAWARRASEAPGLHQPSETVWRQVRAKLRARRGEHAEAEELARESVRIGEETDMLNFQGDAYIDLAEVLAAAGRLDEAAEALEQALDRYERKKNLAMVAQVRPKLEALRQNMPI